MQFLPRLYSNFKLARVNQVRFSVRFVTAISQGFRTCLKLDAILLRQKLHRLATTKIACVNGPLSSLSLMSRKPFLRALRALCNARSYRIQYICWIRAGYGLDTHLSRISSRITVRMLCYFSRINGPIVSLEFEELKWMMPVIIFGHDVHIYLWKSWKVRNDHRS